MALVLFDCDGVLVNTEDLIADVSRQALGAYGLIYTPQQYEDRFLGASMDGFRRAVHEDCLNITGQPAPESLFTDIMGRYMAAEAAYITAIPGVYNFVTALVSAKIPFATASNGMRAGIERKLQRVGLYDFFAGHIFAREDVKDGKPAPDIYLHAMTKMGEADPQRCIVIEDSPLGVTAGHTAGMPVLGYVGGGHGRTGYEQQMVTAGAVFTGKTMSDLACEAFAMITMIDQRSVPTCVVRKAGGMQPF